MRDGSSGARLANSGDFAGARALHRKFLPLMDINFIESNPQPVKSAMASMGLLKPFFRLPMVPTQAQNIQKIEAVLASLNLLETRSVHVAV